MSTNTPTHNLNDSITLTKGALLKCLSLMYHMGRCGLATNDTETLRDSLENFPGITPQSSYYQAMLRTLTCIELHGHPYFAVEGL